MTLNEKVKEISKLNTSLISCPSKGAVIKSNLQELRLVYILPDNLEYCYYIIINLKHNGMSNLKKKNSTPAWTHLIQINRILPYSVLPLTFMLYVIQSLFLILTRWIYLY